MLTQTEKSATVMKSKVIVIEIILVTLICCIIFQSLFKDSISMSMPTFCFLIQSDSNSLPAECFPLTLDLKTFFT